MLNDAFNTDVRPLLAELRQEMGMDPDPLAAYDRSGYAERAQVGASRRHRRRVGRLNYARPYGQPAGSCQVTGGRHPRGPATPQAVLELLERSHRLGSDPRNTNYAGGNTSCKTLATDPVTGAPTELLYVKGSGGDLGTLTEPGLAVLRLDRLRALVGTYPGPDREDEMVAAFDFCLHGKGGAAPSIDTAMHALVGPANVDHLHPDAGIALATSVDGEALTRACFGDRVLWVPWRRPGFQLGLDIADGWPTAPGADRGRSGRPRDHRVGEPRAQSARRVLWKSSAPLRPI